MMIALASGVLFRSKYTKIQSTPEYQLLWLMGAVDHGQVLAEIGRTKITPALARCHPIVCAPSHSEYSKGLRKQHHRPNALQTFF